MTKRKYVKKIAATLTSVAVIQHSVIASNNKVY